MEKNTRHFFFISDIFWEIIIIILIIFVLFLLCDICNLDPNEFIKQMGI